MFLDRVVIRDTENYLRNLWLWVWTLATHGTETYLPPRELEKKSFRGKLRRLVATIHFSPFTCCFHRFFWEEKFAYRQPGPPQNFLKIYVRKNTAWLFWFSRGKCRRVCLWGNFRTPGTSLPPWFMCSSRDWTECLRDRLKNTQHVARKRSQDIIE